MEKNGRPAQRVMRLRGRAEKPKIAKSGRAKTSESPRRSQYHANRMLTHAYRRRDTQQVVIGTEPPQQQLTVSTKTLPRSPNFTHSATSQRLYRLGNAPGGVSLSNIPLHTSASKRIANSSSMHGSTDRSKPIFASCRSALPSPRNLHPLHVLAQHRIFREKVYCLRNFGEQRGLALSSAAIVALSYHGHSKGCWVAPLVPWRIIRQFYGPMRSWQDSNFRSIVECHAANAVALSKTCIGAKGQNARH